MAAAVGDAIDMAELTDYAPESPEPASAHDPDPQRAAWLERRRAGFGASDAIVLLVALGWRSPDDLASYQRASASPIRVRLEPRAGACAVPRILLEKAGRRRQLASTDQMRIGTDREPELVARWTDLVARGAAGSAARHLDSRTVTHVTTAPWPELMPIRDSAEPRLLATPDVLVRDRLGRPEAWDAKCSYEPYHTRYGGAPERVRVQVCAQLACLGDTWRRGGCLEGEGWSRHARAAGEVRSWRIDRDDALIAQIRRACAVAWPIVEAVRVGDSCAVTELRLAAREMG